MYRVLQQRLRRLLDAGHERLLQGGNKGIEKESLRVSRDGKIAQTPHPPELGSALTNSYITTDYSEALLELRTPPLTDIRMALQLLCEIHKFLYSKLDDEVLWATSMPCVMEGDDSIPIAHYGVSNVGKMKYLYRRGLHYRYGDAMQVIAGVHFNYSLPEDFWAVFQGIEGDSRALKDFVSDSYFCLIRNFQRLGWMVPYLFGASPAVCKSFLQQRSAGFSEFDSHTYFKPHATSLRISDIGYTNKTQAGLNISYDHLDDYVASLTRAIETPYPEYERLGVVVDGERRQLNANILQIENEYYSFVRPKQIAQSGEKPTLALRRRGVQYVEVRVLDVDPFSPTGVNEAQARFLEAFLIFCLLHQSPPIGVEEQRELEHNQQTVANRGRDPSLRLLRQGAKLTVRQWAGEVCEKMQSICDLLDQGAPDRLYSKALEAQLSVVNDPERTPSARVLAEMRNMSQSFLDFAMHMSQQHERYFKEAKLSPERVAYFDDVAGQSLHEQTEMEAADQISFDQYLQQYFAGV